MRPLIALMLLLGGCGREPLTQRQHDAVTDIADDATDEVSGKVRRLEERVEALEDRLSRANIPN